MQRTVHHCGMARMEVRSAFCGVCENIVGVCVMWMCKCCRSEDVQQNCLGCTAWPCHIDDDWVTSTNINELVETKIGFNGIDMPDDERVCVCQVFFSFFSRFFMKIFSNLFPHIWMDTATGCEGCIDNAICGIFRIYKIRGKEINAESEKWNTVKQKKKTKTIQNLNKRPVIFSSSRQRFKRRVCNLSSVIQHFHNGIHFGVTWCWSTVARFMRIYYRLSLSAYTDPVFNILLFMSLLKRIFPQNRLSNWNPE